MASLVGGGATVHDSIAMPDGSLVVCGDFNSIGGVPAYSLARWDGWSWSQYAGGISGIGFSLALAPNGDLLVGGAAGFANGQEHFLGRWDGVSWSGFGLPQGNGFTDPVQKVHIDANGLITIGRVQGIYQWNGTSWTQLAPSQVVCWDISRLENGDLVAAGQWPNGAPVQRWTGNSWVPVGTGIWTPGGTQPVIGTRVLPLPGGGMVLGGLFTGGPGGVGNSVAHWDGAAWHAMGSGLYPNRNPSVVRDLARLPNGDILAVGWFFEAQRWNGAQWQAIPASRDYTITPLVDGSLFLGGDHELHRLVPSCPAMASPIGAGCAGQTLTAELPWTGSTWTATGKGLPGAAAVTVAYGVNSSGLSLSPLLPTGVLGCRLLVQPMWLDLVFASGGIAQATIDLPHAVALAGVTFRQQMIAFELPAGGGLGAVTSTNALSLTIGTF